MYVSESLPVAAMTKLLMTEFQFKSSVWWNRSGPDMFCLLVQRVPVYDQVEELCLKTKTSSYDRAVLMRLCSTEGGKVISTHGKLALERYTWLNWHVAHIDLLIKENCSASHFCVCQILTQALRNSVLRARQEKMFAAACSLWFHQSFAFPASLFMIACAKQTNKFIS